MGIGPKTSRQRWRPAGAAPRDYMGGAMPPFPAAGTAWQPPTDIAVVGDTFVIRMEIAGVPLDELRVVQDGKKLVVRGERHRPAEEPGTRYEMLEIQTGPFGRTFEFPDYLRLDNVEARYADGILEIRVERSPEPPRAPVSIRLAPRGTGENKETQ